MKIKSIGLSVPSMKINNEELVDLFKTTKSSLNQAESNRYYSAVSKLLEQAGAKYRHVRDIERGESAYQHILAAARSALVDASIKSSEVDLVIYCGVGKGVIEPSNAYYYASELGMETAECFDIADACMSWVRAMEIAQLYLSSSRASNVLVITGEFHLNIRSPDNITSFNSLRYNFPVYTIGEAATATLLQQGSEPWNFNFVSRPEHFDLCTIPLNGYDTYLRPNKKVGINGIGKFTSFGKELFGNATPLLLNLVKKKGPRPDEVDLYFPHAASKTAYADRLKTIGIPENKFFLKIFEDFGNIVSSSIPAGLHQAKKLGLISDGSRVCLVPASAGISCACVSFKL
jgi:3-oxoacyl-[acyl-carrier-protein] synthase III